MTNFDGYINSSYFMFMMRNIYFIIWTESCFIFFGGVGHCLAWILADIQEASSGSLLLLYRRKIRQAKKVLWTLAKEYIYKFAIKRFDLRLMFCFGIKYD